MIVSTGTAVPFQDIPLPFTIENDSQRVELDKAMRYETEIVVAPAMNEAEPPSMANLCPIGVRAKVIKIIDLPDGSKNAFIACNQRVAISPEAQVGEGIYYGTFHDAPDQLPRAKSEEYYMLMGILEDEYDYMTKFLQEMSNVQMTAPVELQRDKLAYLNFMIVTSPISHQEKLRMLEESNLYSRGELALHAFYRVRRELDFKKEMMTRASVELDKEQREHFIKAQIKTLQNEIGDGEENDFETLAARAEQKDWPEEMAATFAKELSKLRRLNTSSPDYALQYTYLDTLLSLPWNVISQDDIEIGRLKKDLDKDHTGLEKVKERIVEHIAVLKLRGDMRSPILCLVGPPGVGKTSLCKSIAESIGRDYARISLGGLHDETQLRGHRRTYVGALPGRIIASLQKTDHNNPLFVLDEIDKIGNDHRGDPAQALLEVLDPEQNSKFHDNYLDVDYDLSKILFIATANTTSTISAPLLDRMEVIDLQGYITEEKILIAQRHLVGKQLKQHGFRKNEIKITEDALRTIIESYTRESGVRQLEKKIAAILRKLAVAKVSGEKYPKTIDAKKARALLGKEEILPDIYDGALPTGVVAGLAWTPAGGEILYFESSLSPGKGVVTLTGNMGDVMKESATIAMQWLRANAEKLGVDSERIAKTDVHLHVPEGAVPKDGPSAGITMVSSLVSSFTGRPVREGVSMTGEMTLRGKVLPVGGVKEKILAAKRAGITDIILSEKNRRDIEEIRPDYLAGLRFHYARSIGDVLEVAFGEDAFGNVGKNL